MTLNPPVAQADQSPRQRLFPECRRSYWLPQASLNSSPPAARSRTIRPGWVTQSLKRARIIRACLHAGPETAHSLLARALSLVIQIPRDGVRHPQAIRLADQRAPLFPARRQRETDAPFLRAAA